MLSKDRSLPRVAFLNGCCGILFQSARQSAIFSPGAHHLDLRLQGLYSGFKGAQKGLCCLWLLNSAIYALVVLFIFSLHFP